MLISLLLGVSQETLILLLAWMKFKVVVNTGLRICMSLRIVSLLLDMIISPQLALCSLGPTKDKALISLKRLDRMLGNNFWFSTHTESQVLIKPRGIMDHNPLLLSVPMVLDKISKPFQFFHYMTELPGFLAIVKNTWNTRSYGDPMGIFCKKLKLINCELVKLNKTHGNLHSLVNSARANLHDIQEQLGNNHLDDQLLTREREAIKNLEDAILAE
ncbi:hypothetical protein AgCh_006255 [Apium graveolens]